MPNIKLTDEQLINKIHEVIDKKLEGILEAEQAEVETEKEQLFVDTIKIRLDGISEATKRARLAFIVSTIASCAILITLYNSYWSHSRNFAFENEKQSEVTIINAQSFSTPLPLPENNRRNLVNDWIKNTNVSVNLLGIQINVNEFSILGSLALTVISFWLFFSLRRENRASVALLRDIYMKVDDNKINKEEKGKGDWNIVNLTYQGIVHRNIFMSSPSQNEQPLSLPDSLPDSQVEKHIPTQAFISLAIKVGNFVFKKNVVDINDLVSEITIKLRKMFNFLLFLPMITIICILTSDVISLFYPSPFRPTGDSIWSQLEFWDKLNVFRDALISITFITLNFIICKSCVIFQNKTTESLTWFSKKYDLE